MLRVRSDALLGDDEGRRWFRGQLFHGLAYEVEADGRVAGLVSMVAGRAADPSSDWLPLPPGGVRADRASLEMAGDYGPWTWLGLPVCGVVYSFAVDGTCSVEETFDDGLPDDRGRRAWYGSGAPNILVEQAGSTVWFEDGSVRTRRIDDVLLLNLIVSEQGWLRGIVLKGASLLDVDSIARRPFAAKLLLLGAGVDDALLARLAALASFRDVQRLAVTETALGRAAVDVLASAERLLSVTLEGNAGLGSIEAERLRALRPEMMVELRGSVDEG